MNVYTFSEARQNLASVLDEAQRKGAVRIKRRDGSELRDCTRSFPGISFGRRGR